MIGFIIPPEELKTPPMSENPWQLLPKASNHAASLDGLYVFITVLCAISMVLIVGAGLYFMWKYKARSKDQKTDPVTHNAKLEFIWSAIPSVLLLVIFAWGEIGFMNLMTPPEDAHEIRIEGQKWMWTITYPNHPGGPALTCPENAEECDPEVKTPTLFVPLGEPVRLTMSSTDVIHSFYIPAFRVKKDVVPGRYSYIWFTATMEGEFPIFCTEYCGDEHSSMLAKVIVVPPEEYEAKVAKATELKLEEGETMAEYGERLSKIQGCATCHSIDGTEKVGPSWQGLYGREEGTNVGTVKADDNYIRESILDPGAKIVNGYPNGMASYQGKLNDEQIAALIEYMKTLK